MAQDAERGRQAGAEAEVQASQRNPPRAGATKLQAGRQAAGRDPGEWCLMVQVETSQVFAAGKAEQRKEVTQVAYATRQPR